MSLYEELKKFGKQDKISFHIPGHKAGAGLSRGFKQDAFKLDVTEFAQTDDLQNPEGILSAAQARAAEAFGAGASFYLTNGSSIGLHAAILGSCRRGDKLLLDRTCHKAVAAAVVLAGAEPVFVTPDFDRTQGIYIGLTAQKIKQSLAEHPDIVGAVITSPTYYGICSDIQGIGACLHNSGKFLVVDEAHGAHFAFHEALPRTALELGADLCIQSAHKTLPALGQCSFLHVNKESLIPADQAARSLRILQTTSPSYLLMASLDEAVEQMVKNGRKTLGETIDQVQAVKTAVRKHGKLEFVDSRAVGKPQDMLRLVVDFRKTGVSGQTGAEMLKEAFGIYPEMADGYHVVFVVTKSNTKSDLTHLRHALIQLSKTQMESMTLTAPAPLPEVKLAMNPDDAWALPRQQLPLEEAVGKIAAGIVSACPPGAAVLVPGQRIDREAAAYLRTNQIADTIEVVIQ